MASSQLTATPAVFTFPTTGQPVRSIMRDREPWWIAADIASALGYRMASDATRWLDEDEKDTHPVRTPGGMQDVTVICESGLYALILRSKLPQAKEFRRWVTREVLPAIRRTGGYRLPEQPPLFDDVPPQPESVPAAGQEALAAAIGVGVAAGLAAYARAQQDDVPATVRPAAPRKNARGQRSPITPRDSERVRLIIRGLYDVLGARPMTGQMLAASVDEGIRCSSGQVRSLRLQIEAAEPHLKRFSRYSYPS